ncbi:methylmalonyl-CoA epimerase, mitochondrial-like isoform X2 [Acanthaster planci]|uniref:Methylmalonyl-CoA epimerase, mitochondrial n=1 Tax=Acanthaster planci TaxID=133434 RepID=A0A8B7ZTF1_ACAPL|nr:methylmalonyl-CoA epimerase, mitochondrial-like isoform X2 [Acanthaster planci]
MSYIFSPLVANSFSFAWRTSWLSRHHYSDSAWSLGRLNHVAIAVPDLTDAVKVYRDVFQAKVSEPQALPEHGVTVVFVELENTKLELLEPLGDNSPIGGYLKKKPGGGMHHVCLEVNNISEAMKTLQEKKVKVLDPEPKIGAHSKPVVFLHPKDCGGVLVELEEA